MTPSLEKFRACGIRPSAQRLAIYDYLAGHKTHPTAEDVYLALSPSLPTLSLTTVYSALRLFCECGAAQCIVVEENEMRFDADTSFHAHFKCDRCGSLADLPVPADSPVRSFKLPARFRARQAQLYFRGLCPACSGAAK